MLTVRFTSCRSLPSPRRRRRRTSRRCDKREVPPDLDIKMLQTIARERKLQSRILLLQQRCIDYPHRSKEERSTRSTPATAPQPSSPPSPTRRQPKYSLATMSLTPTLHRLLRLRSALLRLLVEAKERKDGSEGNRSCRLRWVVSRRMRGDRRHCTRANVSA